MKLCEILNTLKQTTVSETISIILFKIKKLSIKIENINLNY